MTVILLLFFAGLVSALVAAQVADAKGLSSSGWAIFTFFFAPIGLLGLAAMPDLRLRSYLKALAIKLEAIDDPKLQAVAASVASSFVPESQRLGIFNAAVNGYKKIGGKLPSFSASEVVSDEKVVLRSSNGATIVTMVFYDGQWIRE